MSQTGRVSGLTYPDGTYACGRGRTRRHVSGKGSMQTSSVPWSPRVGDDVALKDYRLVGRVLGIQGGGTQQTFSVLTDPPAATDPPGAARLAMTVGRARGTYRLDELVPYHRPRQPVSATIAAVGTHTVTRSFPRRAGRRGRRVSDSEWDMAPVPCGDSPVFMAGLRVRCDPSGIRPIIPDPEGDYVIVAYEPAAPFGTRHVPRFVIERRAARHR
jgi:hypothetical protein